MLCLQQISLRQEVWKRQTYWPGSIYLRQRDELLLFAYRLSLQTEASLASTARQSSDPVERLIATLLRAPPVDEQASLDMRIWLGFHGTGAGNPRGSYRFGAG